MEAKTLRAIIQERGLKQVWIAQRMGLTRALISQWVNGSIPIPEKHIDELRRILK